MIPTIKHSGKGKNYGDSKRWLPGVQERKGGVNR